MDIRELLQANFDRLLEQYHSNVEGVLVLQDTLIRDILPSVRDELELDQEATEWAREWLNDTSSLFRISRRNNYTMSFAMESIRKNLVWRLNYLLPSAPPSPIPTMHCLPGSVRDPFGRPMLIIDVVAFNESSDASKLLIVQAVERLRAHLHVLNTTRDSENPTLQYVVLLDLKQLSIQTLNIDLIPWVLREVIPRFPGMLAAVFMINYSWAHAGMWSVIKRVLPASALSRVFFPSQEELVQYFTTSALPKDYGGSLPFLTHLDDPLRINRTPPMLPRPPSPVNESQPSAPNASHPTASTITSIPATSLLNPFFGYPASSAHGSTSLHHGRRRKRDLARTLTLLLWRRWRGHFTLAVFFTAIALAIRVLVHRRSFFIPRDISAWRAVWFSVLRRS